MKRSALVIVLAVFSVAMSAECAVSESVDFANRETVVNCSRDRSMKRMLQRLRKNRNRTENSNQDRKQNEKTGSGLSVVG